jgi:hypothetical protein
VGPLNLLDQGSFNFFLEITGLPVIPEVPLFLTPGDLPGSQTASQLTQRTAEKEVGIMMTLTGEWNASINAFPAFADSVSVASVCSGSRRMPAFPGLPRRR